MMVIFITSPSEGFRNKSDPFRKLTYITKQAKYQTSKHNKLKVVIASEAKQSDILDITGFALIMDTDKLPWVLTRYRHPDDLIKSPTSLGFLEPSTDVNSLLSKGIGWLSGGRLKISWQPSSLWTGKGEPACR